MNMTNSTDVVCFGEARQVARCLTGHGARVTEVMGQSIDAL